MSVSAACFEANFCRKVKPVNCFCFFHFVKNALTLCPFGYGLRVRQNVLSRSFTVEKNQQGGTCNPARLISHPALLEFGMHDDDSVRMVVLAKRGWLGAKTCKLDERGLGRLHMLGSPFQSSSNAFRKSLLYIDSVANF